MKLDSLRQRLKAGKRPGRRRPARTARQRAKRNGLLLALATFAAVVIIPVGRPAGYGLANGVCSSASCVEVLSRLPQCTGIGRDKAEATTVTSFVRQIGKHENFTIIGSVDGRITASTNTDHGVELYSFNDGAQAKNWVLDRSLESASVIESAVGPNHSAAYAGYLTVLESMGLLPHETTQPAATGARFTAAAAGQEGLTYRNEATGITTQRLLLSTDTEKTPALRRFAARLGIADSMLVTIRKTRDGKPNAIEFEGPAATGWNLGVLRTTPFSSDSTLTELNVSSAGLTWRSYSLDLTRSSNLAAFEGLVEAADTGGHVVSLLKTGQFDALVAAGELSANPYEQMRDRIRDDGVLTETTLQGRFSQKTDIDTMMRVLGLYENHDFADFTAADITSADLALAGAQLAPFATCDSNDAGEQDGER